MTTATPGSILAKMVGDQRGEVEATNQGGEATCEVEPAVGAESQQGVLVNPTETLELEIRVVSEEIQQQTHRGCHHINFLHPRAGRITSPASTVVSMTPEMDLRRKSTTAATGWNRKTPTGTGMRSMAMGITNTMARAGSTQLELTDIAVEQNQ